MKDSSCYLAPRYLVAALVVVLAACQSGVDRHEYISQNDGKAATDRTEAEMGPSDQTAIAKATVAESGSLQQVQQGKQAITSLAPQSEARMLTGGIYQSMPVAPPAAYPKYSRDQYETLFESGFRDPLLSPLSTFALDVDTASYSNLRRFLNRGALPPKDAVRLEELLNYFDYDLAEPAGADPLAIYSELGAAPWAKDKQLAMVQVKAKALSLDEQRSNRFVFLIDTSGSMQGANRLPLLKKAFQGLVETLDDDDRIAIVTYAGSAGVALHSVSGRDKTAIYQALQSLQPGGSTAGAAGIDAAYQIARQQFDETANNRVILATDGDFNVGPHSSSELIDLIDEQRDKGIYLTVLGFGEGNLGDGRMNRIAGHGDGNYYYIDSELEARRVLVDKLQRSLVTVARDVKLQVEFNPATVASYRLLGYETRRMAAEDFHDDKKDAGEVGAGQVVTALYEIRPRSSGKGQAIALRYQQRQTAGVKGNSASGEELMWVKLRYRPLNGGEGRALSQSLGSTASAKNSRNFDWAANVAAFAMLMGDSDFKGQANMADIIARAEALAKDGSELEREFVSLTRIASMLRQQQTGKLSLNAN